MLIFNLFELCWAENAKYIRIAETNTIHMSAWCLLDIGLWRRYLANGKWGRYELVLEIFGIRIFK